MRLTDVCTQLRENDMRIRSITEDYSPCLGDEFFIDRIPEEVWESLEQAYKQRSKLEVEFDVLCGNDESAKLDLWRAHR
jgi:hypothetical protein